MAEMIEQVAKAIEGKMFAPHELPLDEELHGKYLDTARAAIVAMREPTGEMKDAGAASLWPKKGPPRLDGQPSKCWRAMISEALK